MVDDEFRRDLKAKSTSGGSRNGAMGRAVGWRGGWGRGPPTHQGRRNERKSGPANACVSRGGVWGGAPAFFFWFCFVRFGAKYAIAN